MLNHLKLIYRLVLLDHLKITEIYGVDGWQDSIRLVIIFRALKIEATYATARKLVKYMRDFIKENMVVRATPKKKKKKWKINQ